MIAAVLVIFAAVITALTLKILSTRDTIASATDMLVSMIDMIVAGSNYYGNIDPLTVALMNTAAEKMIAAMLVIFLTVIAPLNVTVASTIDTLAPAMDTLAPEKDMIVAATIV
eukprot:11712677-Ditylum_brightwellii.AAC.1